jgi:hypothetical protein
MEPQIEILVFSSVASSVGETEETGKLKIGRKKLKIGRIKIKIERKITNRAKKITNRAKKLLCPNPC